MGRSVGISERVNIGTEGLDPGTKALDQGMIFCEKIDFANGLNSYCLNNFYKNASYGKTDNPSWFYGKNYCPWAEAVTTLKKKNLLNQKNWQSRVAYVFDETLYVIK